MAIPELEFKRAEKLLSRFCQERIPPHARHQVQLHFKKRGNTITLYERRPFFLEPDRYSDMSIAKFAYDPKDNDWSLKYPDRNSRWHLYTECESARNLEVLIAEVDADPACVFWG